ncbi:MAG: META domain-containing protein [Planctomycetota bacterium]
MKRRPGGQFRFLWCVAAATVLTGCRGGPPGEWSQAELQSWRLAAIPGSGTLAAPVPTLKFSGDGRAVGSTGVNRWFAPYRADAAGPGSLTFGSAGVTRMAAASASLAQQELKFLEVLSRIDGYRLRDQRLELTSGRETVLILVADEPEDPTGSR